MDIPGKITCRSVTVELDDCRLFGSPLWVYSVQVTQHVNGDVGVTLGCYSTLSGERNACAVMYVRDSLGWKILPTGLDIHGPTPLPGWLTDLVESVKGKVEL